MSGSTTGRTLATALGALFVIAGIVGGVVLWLSASQRRDSTVENFARAPVGCDTTLDFDDTGEFVVFVESVGSVEAPRGDCGVDGDYDLGDGEVPDVEVSVVGPDGETIEVGDSTDAIGYTVAGFAGDPRFTIRIDEAGDHVLRAESGTDEMFVVAVGRDPRSAVMAFRFGAVAAAIAGIVIGCTLILLGRRRRSAPAPAPAPAGGQPSAPWAPVGQVPAGPPVYGGVAAPPSRGAPGSPTAPPPPPAPPPPFSPTGFDRGRDVDDDDDRTPPRGVSVVTSPPVAPSPPSPSSASSPPQDRASIPGEPGLMGAPAGPPTSHEPSDGVPTPGWAPNPPPMADTDGRRGQTTSEDEFRHRDDLQKRRGGVGDDVPPPPN